MEKRRISVIIPVYNLRDYLDLCLESVCAQTYDCLEILLIDDGSTDGTAQLCDHWAVRDSRIRVIHKENGGLGGARNLGLKNATGALITFVDGDDWLEPDAYQAMVSAMDQYQADIVCSGQMKTVPAEAECFSGEEASVHMLQDSRPVRVVVWNKLYTAAMIREFSFPEDQTVGEDQMYVARVLLKCRRCVWLNRTLYHYRFRQGSLSHSTCPQIKLKEDTNVRQQRIRFYQQAGKEFLARLSQWEMLRFVLDETMYVERNTGYSDLQKREGALYLQQLARQLPASLGRTRKERLQHFLIKRNIRLYQKLVGLYWDLGDRLRKGKTQI